MPKNTSQHRDHVHEDESPRPMAASLDPDVTWLVWYSVTSDEVTLYGLLPEHRPEYC